MVVGKGGSERAGEKVAKLRGSHEKECGYASGGGRNKQ